MSPAMALLSGAVVAAGICAVVVGLLRRTPQLADTLRVLTDERPVTPASTMPEATVIETSRSDRIGAWLYRVSPLPLSVRQRQDLQVQGRSVAEFYADKLALALTGLVFPVVLVTAFGVVNGRLALQVPVAVGLGGLVVGYFVPDLLLRRGSTRVRQDAGHALLTYIDLVTLERLANASATQALQNAAGVSDIALFVRIRRSLGRAQLEQQSPFGELRRLADQLALSELADLVDVLQLDESGASLAGALRARVRELRNAHLAREQQQANAVSESMTIFMAIPALIFGLFFMVPPLLRIVGS